MNKLLIAFLFLPLFGASQEKTDTVKVVLLVCDTAREYFVNEYITYDTVIDGIGYGKVIRDTTYGNPNQIVYWIFGYEVLGKKEIGVKTFDMNGNEMPELFMPQLGVGYIVRQQYKSVHKKYLDENKKPLSKNIVVWQSKNR